MRITNHRDFWAGVMFAAFGVLFVVLSQQYPIGNSAKMGPGYFPTVLGALMAVLGLIVAIGGLSAKAAALHVNRFDWRVILLILAAVLLFGAMLPKMGLVLSLVTLIVLSAIASHEFRLRDTLVSLVVLGLLAYGVFVKGLELQFRVWPIWLTQS